MPIPTDKETQKYNNTYFIPLDDQAETQVQDENASQQDGVLETLWESNSDDTMSSATDDTTSQESQWWEQGTEASTDSGTSDEGKPWEWAEQKALENVEQAVEDWDIEKFKEAFEDLTIALEVKNNELSMKDKTIEALQTQIRDMQWLVNSHETWRRSAELELSNKWRFYDVVMKDNLVAELVMAQTLPDPSKSEVAITDAVSKLASKYLNIDVNKYNEMLREWSKPVTDEESAPWMIDMWSETQGQSWFQPLN